MHCFDVKPGVLEGDLQTFPDHQKPANFHPKLDRLHSRSCRPSSPDPHQQIMSTATKEKQKIKPKQTQRCKRIRGSAEMYLFW